MAGHAGLGSSSIKVPIQENWTTFFFFYGSNWNLAVQPCGLLLLGIRLVAQLADWNTMDPMQTLPLLPWRRGTACTRLCSSLCVCAESTGTGRRCGRLQPCSKAICLGQKVPLSFTDGWACIPISSRERRAKRAQKKKRHLCVCLTSELSL